MHALPCPLCGYDAPGVDCPHCGQQCTEPTLDPSKRRLGSGISAGLRAIPMGFSLLMSTSGVKRFLIPPILLTLIAFGISFNWLFGVLDSMFTAIEVEDPAALDMAEGYLRNGVVMLMETGAVVWLAGFGKWILFLALATAVAFFAFSIVYEALAGPFLDEVQGRVEERWFGNNPRDAIERPTDLPVKRCMKISAIAGVPALACTIAFWLLAGPMAWALLIAAPLPFVFAGLVSREYGRWLWWVVRVESDTLWVSIKAASLVALVMLFGLLLQFIPLVGAVMYYALVGFTVSLSLLDIPFSRRQWSFSTRLRFIRQHALPLLLFGSMASLVFMIPIVGLVIMVPVASVGGLWLVCRLDKNGLRPEQARIAPLPAGPTSALIEAPPEAASAPQPSADPPASEAIEEVPESDASPQAEEPEPAPADPPATEESAAAITAEVTEPPAEPPATQPETPASADPDPPDKA